MANETVTYGGVPCEKRNLITESFWQRGCDDAKAGRPETPPTNEGPYSRRNQGYAAGYDYGKTHYRMAEVGKRIIARELTPAITPASDATPQEELKTLCDWVIASVNDTADECNVEVWLLANELRKAARRLKEILE